MRAAHWILDKLRARGRTGLCPRRGLDERNYKKWGRPGIRAQLLDITKKKLKMDFVLKCDDRFMHVLNAVSPAFTCSLPFASYVCDHIKALT